MAVTCKVKVLEEVAYDENAIGKDWVICFQWCKYMYSDGISEEGYRFIWRRPDGSLQAARGQARIPSLRTIEKLMDKAKQQGWGHLVGGEDGEY